MDYTVNRVGFTFTVIKYHYDGNVTGPGVSFSFFLPKKRVGEREKATGN